LPQISQITYNKERKTAQDREGGDTRQRERERERERKGDEKGTRPPQSLFSSFFRIIEKRKKRERERERWIVV
jgi:hypothetical protein